MTEPATWSRVARALLGAWPSQVASWDEEGIAAYIEELEARAVTPDQALVAIRSCPAGQKFPPSAPEIAGLAHRDPDQPTSDELLAQLYGPGGVFGFKRSNVTVSPWVLAFVKNYGEDRLRLLEVEDPERGGMLKHQLKVSYEKFLEANEGRAVSAIANGRRGEGLAKLDPLSALDIEMPKELTR